MKSNSLWGVLGTSCFAALAFAACTVSSSSTTGDGGLSGDDAANDGTASSSGASSSGASSSGASSSGGGSSSGVAEGGGEGGGDAGVCPQANFQVGAGACDTCMKTYCCNELVVCDTAGEAGVDDAGLTQCEQNLDCVVRDAMLADASLNVGLADCFPNEASAPPADLTSLLSCASTHCAMDCAQ